MAIEGEQEFSTDVEASVAECFAAITDFPAYPSWSSPIERIAVLKRYDNKLARLVEFHADMKLRTVRYVLEYRYEKPVGLTWQSAGGDVESIEGAYSFEKLGPKRTRATCRQSIRLGFWIPGAIRAIFERQALKQSVLEFKAEAERRSAAKRGKGR